MNVKYYNKQLIGSMAVAVIVLGTPMLAHASRVTFDFENHAVTSGNGDLTSLPVTHSGLTLKLTRQLNGRFDVTIRSDSIGFTLVSGRENAKVLVTVHDLRDTSAPRLSGCIEDRRTWYAAA
jgi:hypothetical protein